LEHDADAVYGNITNVRPDGREQPYPHPTEFLDHWDPELFIERLVTAHGPMLQAALFRRSILDRIGGVDQGFAHQEDWPIHILVARQAKRVRVHARPVVYYRDHPESTVRSKDRQLRDWKIAIARKYLKGAQRRRAVAAAYFILAGTSVSPRPLRAMAYFLRSLPYVEARQNARLFLRRWWRAGFLYQGYRVKLWWRAKRAAKDARPQGPGKGRANG
jgi:hypothetical protein